MTQQSLITRLKAVEEALEATQEVLGVAEMDHPDEAFIEFSDSTITPALSDLRELIKEVEGQRHVGVIEHDTSSYVWEELAPGTNLYTALGEKPTAAEQQLAKESNHVAP